MLIFLVTMSAIAVMLFVEWQHSIMSRRVRVMTENRPRRLSTPSTRHG
jgi:hypothetical protein